MEPEIQDPKLVDVEKSPDDDPLEGLPNEAALKELIKRTGYMITQENGQRKYGGPPPNWDDRATPRGAEVFVVRYHEMYLKMNWFRYLRELVGFMSFV